MDERQKVIEDALKEPRNSNLPPSAVIVCKVPACGISISNNGETGKNILMRCIGFSPKGEPIPSTLCALRSH